jgi:hypothetical protein
MVPCGHALEYQPALRPPAGAAFFRPADRRSGALRLSRWFYRTHVWPTAIAGDVRIFFSAPPSPPAVPWHGPGPLEAPAAGTGYPLTSGQVCINIGQQRA